MLRNSLETMVWAQVYAQQVALDYLTLVGRWIAIGRDLANKKDIEEMRKWNTYLASRAADNAVLLLRQHIIANYDFPRTPHVLDMSRYLLKDADGNVPRNALLDFDSDAEGDL